MNKRLLAFLIGRAAAKGRSVTDLLALQEADVAARTATELQEMIGANTVLTMALQMLAGNKLEEAQGLLQGLLDALPKQVAEVAPPAPAAAAVAPAAQAAPATTAATAEVPASAGVAQESQVVQDLQLKVALLESGLSKAAQESVRAEMARLGRFTSQQLQEAITDRQALTAGPARANGLVQPVEVSSRGCVQPQDALQARMDLMVGYRPDKALQEADPALFAAYQELQKHPAMNRIKRIYQDYCDDRNCEFKIGANSILHEALSTDFPTCLSISMNKTLNQYWDMQDQPGWKDFIYIDESVDDYYTRTNLMRGGFGNLGDVVESTSTDTFPELGTPQEISTSFSIVSKGGKFVLTKHMVKGDKNGIFSSLVQDFVNVAMHVLNRFAWGLLVGRTSAGINQANTWDSSVIYSTAHGNYSTNALSQANIASARLAMRNMRRPGLKTTITEAIADTVEETTTFASTTGMFPDTMLQIGTEILRVKSVTNSTVAECERGYMGSTAATHDDNAVVYEIIDQMPTTKLGLIVPTPKETAMYTALTTPGVTGGTNNDLSIVNEEFKKGQIVPYVVDPHYLGGNLFNWFLAVYKEFRRHTTLAFMDNKQKPEILLQDQPTVGKVFDRNNYTYRTEFEFGGCNNDYLGLYGNFASS